MLIRMVYGETKTTGSQPFLTLLVIDDDPLVLELAAEALSQEGLRIVSANTPEHGLDLFFRNRPQIVWKLNEIVWKVQSQLYKEAAEAHEGERIEPREEGAHVGFLLPRVRKLPNLQSVVGQRQKRRGGIPCRRLTCSVRVLYGTFSL